MATKNPQAGSHLDAPATFAHPASGESSVPVVEKPNKGFTPIATVLLKRYDDRIPVHVRDEGHLRELEQVHGVANLLKADGSKYEPLPPVAAHKPAKKSAKKKAAAKKRGGR
jgi:hypothetical protein